MKKGFTLIELLGALIILAIIGTISFVVYTKYKIDAEEELDKSIIQLIYQASKNYINNTKTDKKVGNQYCVQFQDLVNYEYLNEPIKKGNGDEYKLNSFVRVTIKENNQMDFKIIENGTCEEYIIVDEFSLKGINGEQIKLSYAGGKLKINAYFINTSTTDQLSFIQSISIAAVDIEGNLYNSNNIPFTSLTTYYKNKILNKYETKLDPKFNQPVLIFDNIADEIEFENKNSGGFITGDVSFELSDYKEDSMLEDFYYLVDIPENKTGKDLEVIISIMFTLVQKDAVSDGDFPVVRTSNAELAYLHYGNNYDISILIPAN